MRRLNTPGSATAIADGARFDRASVRCEDLDYAASLAVFRTYRSMNRFIRRHVVNGGDRRIRAWPSEWHPQWIGNAIKGSQEQRCAWAYALWCMSIEPLARERLWRNDRPCPELPIIVLGSAGLDFELSIEKGTEHLTRAQCRWFLGHAASVCLRAAWSRASALAEGMANAGDAFSGPGVLEERFNLKLSGKVERDGSLTLSASGPCFAGGLEPRPYRDKASRAAQAQRMFDRRRERVLQVCQGHCLRFSKEEGWQDVEATPPNFSGGSDDVRSLRLLAPGRPTFYLFPTPQGYCARLRDAPVEVHAEAPRIAIENLRDAHARYPKLLGAVPRTNTC